MSRSLAAAPGRHRAAGSRPRRAAPKSPPPAFGVLRPFTAAASLARAAAAFVLRRRRLRIALLAALVALPLLGCGWLWFRQSSFVSVQKVRIVGVHGPEAQAVEAALVDAARGMSTLDVSTGALSAAVAPLRVVRAVRAIPSFPHGLRIEVSEQLPVAALTVAGVRTAVAADGVVLGPALLSGSLPSVAGSFVPAPGRRVGGASLRAALIVLGAAPAPLAKYVERAFTGAEGLTVAMRNGLLVYFGDASRPHAKWLSLVRVLADSELRRRLLRGRAPAVASGRRVPRGRDPAGRELDRGRRGGRTGGRLGRIDDRRARRGPVRREHRGVAGRRGTVERLRLRHDRPVLRRRRSGRRRSGLDERSPGLPDRPRARGLASLGKPEPQLEPHPTVGPILRQWSRVGRSATFVARVVALVDRAKFPA